MILDSTGLRVALEHKLAIAAVEYAIEQYQTARYSQSVDDRLEAAESLFKATKDAWALLHALEPEMPRLGPIGVVTT